MFQGYDVQTALYLAGQAQQFAQFITLGRVAEKCAQPLLEILQIRQHFIEQMDLYVTLLQQAMQANQFRKLLCVPGLLPHRSLHPR